MLFGKRQASSWRLYSSVTLVTQVHHALEA